MKTLLLFLAISYTSLSATGQTTTISLQDSIGDNGPCDKATLYKPSGIAIDAAGNLYIADKGNNRIRKVDSKTFIITTIAGNGIAGYGGDNGLAIMAELNSPTGVALDKSGNIYIADFDNNRIRKVNNSTGIITTIAGTNEVYKNVGDNGPSTSAHLANPIGLAIDKSENMYIADFNSYRIRKIDASTSIITTVGGTGMASLDWVKYSGDGGLATATKLVPYAITLDKTGNIYFSDATYHLIRKIDASTGIITTIAGGAGTWLNNQSKEYNYDWNKLYDESRGAKATSIDITQGPWGLALDNDGNVYFTTGKSNIYKINADGTIAEAEKGFIKGFAVDDNTAITGITIDSNNNIYISDAGNNMIFKIDYSTGIVIREAGHYVKSTKSDDDDGW